MKIVAVIENIDNEYGGPANSLPNFLYGMRAEVGVNSIIYSTIHSDCEKNEFIDRFSIPWVRCQLAGPIKVKYSRELRDKLSSEVSDGDILFSNNLWNYPAYLAAKLAKRKNIPHIASIRGTLYPWSLAQGKYRKKIAWHAFQKSALQKADLIHVTCIDEYRAVRDLGITSPIAVVPHGINYEDYQNLPSTTDSVKHLELKCEKKYILFMSRLHEKKGLDLLLNVWPDLVKHNPEWCLLIVGPDYSNYIERINHLAVEHGIGDNLKTLGMLTGYDKECVLSVSEFFVLPSYTENFGVVIGEALAAGLPTITTTGTPWSEINSYNCGNFISLSKENLKEALNDMMALDSVCLGEMSNNAKSLIKENYSWSAQAVKFKQAIEFVLKGKPAPNVVYTSDEMPPEVDIIK
ncbi:glycosyltransferase [Salinivibrio sp. MA607]|uniref:glycosyltransferase n=1 Tax=Salinivibrio sp. MA607 TaxID=1909457 RepID=UPI000989198B|nr:glycosyltransferase [Salinivibrio sp. MA607]OOF01862.1 hypothetical protein BZG81_15350 [Salinivibrio sp. MA607]